MGTVTVVVVVVVVVFITDCDRPVAVTIRLNVLGWEL